MPAPEKNQNAVKPEDEQLSSFLYVRCTQDEKASFVRAANADKKGLALWAREILNRAAARKP